GNLVGRGAYSVIVAGLTLSMLLATVAYAQDAPQPAQGQEQSGQEQQAEPPSAAPPAKAEPKYVPQDANRPPDGNDREPQGNSPSGAPSPSSQDDPNYEEQQEPAPPDEQQALPPPAYRGRVARPAPPTAPPPASLQIPSGTVLLVRINEFLSSDK